MNVLRILLLFIVIASISGCWWVDDDEKCIGDHMYTRCCDEIWINDSCCIQEYGPEYRVNFCKLGGGEAEGGCGRKMGRDLDGGGEGGEDEGGEGEDGCGRKMGRDLRE